jgi:hypothetical protein
MTGSLRTSRIVLGPGFEPLHWITGDFDGNVSNGEEVAVGFRRDDNGRFGFIAFDNLGNYLGRGMAFNDDFTKVQYLPFSAAALGGADVILVAGQRVGTRPAVQLWTTGGVLLDTWTLFNRWVRDPR